MTVEKGRAKRGRKDLEHDGKQRIRRGDSSRGVELCNKRKTTSHREEWTLWWCMSMESKMWSWWM